jgi:hypothetical protein
MDEDTVQRVSQHIATARDGRVPQRFDAALERARTEVESLAAAAVKLECELPDRVADAVQDGLRREVSLIARNPAEIRGLLNNAIHRLERIEEDVLAERSARIEDLALLVDLVATGWRSVDARLEQLEPVTVPASVRPLAAEPVAADARNVA